jgi:hypothetical protein
VGDDDKVVAPPKVSYVLVARDYADIAHLENPNVIERILSRSRTEKVAYVSALLTSGLSKHALAGPKIAVAAMAVEALTDFGKEISEWIKGRKIPEDFSGRPSGYQTWVELLVEIDSNPTDAERLKAMKAMFLAANRVNATDAQSVVAYQLFQIAKRLDSGDLLLLKAVFEAYCAGDTGGGRDRTLRQWATSISGRLGHQVLSLILRHERVLIEQELLHPRPKVVPGMDVFPPRSAQELETVVYECHTGRLTDLGLEFCKNLENYKIETQDDR